MMRSLSRILPERMFRVLESRLNLDRLFEVRLRAGQGVCVNYHSKRYFLTDAGLSDHADSAIFADEDIVKSVILKAAEYSLYAANDQLKQGFITIEGGVRVGIAGETVAAAGEVTTIKNFSSVNIRIPHEVKGAADKVYRFCTEENGSVHNTLILSPPGAGKTTVLRDLARQLGSHSATGNILLIDERSELAASIGGKPALDVGAFTDVLSNCDKAFAFSAGIRALSPQIVITDELSGDKDALAVAYAAACGVRVIASAHAENHTDIEKKPGFDKLLQTRIFTRFIDLSARNGPGTVEGVFDADFVRVDTP